MTDVADHVDYVARQRLGGTLCALIDPAMAVDATEFAGAALFLMQGALADRGMPKPLRAMRRWSMRQAPGCRIDA